MSGYDAGAITASLSVDTSKAKADLDKISAEVKKLEDASHKIKISAVFDNSSLTRARKMFADLDNAISRDSMQRLRSSPQGSVLGALNALFSPHPVTGAPSPQQSASGGLLGKMLSGQGGGAPSPSGTSGGQSAAGRTATTNDIRDVLTGQQPKDTSTTNTIRDVTEGQQPGNVKTEDLITPKVVGGLPGNVTTTDTVKVVTEGGGPKDTSTTDTVHEKLDQGDAAKLVTDSGAAGDRSGASFSSMFTSHVRSVLTSVAGLFGGGGGGGSIGDAAGKSGGGAGDSFAKGFGAHLIAGIGPVILGIPAKMALLVPAVGTALAALPALAGVIGTGMGVAMIGGLVAVVAKNSPAIKAQLTGIGADAKQMLATIGAPIIPALTKAFAQVPALLKSITGPLTDVMKTVAPQIAGVFAGLTPIIRGLVGIMQAAAPAFGPVVEGLEKLVANILPGIQIVIKAMVPFLSQFAGILATLGTHLGQFFSAAAPAIGASMKVLGALLDLIGGLLPVIVKLGGVFATALAPAIATFAAAIKALTPFLTTIGSIFAQLAGAVLGDLVSAFTALGTLFTGIAPALNSFAKSLGIVFTTLENSGVFAILGDALEALAAPLAGLISALLNGLAPVLPPLFTAIGQIAAILAGGLAAAVAAVLPPLTTLATTVLGAIAKILPAVLPLFVKLAGIFTGGVVTVIQGVASALTAIIKAIPPGVIEALAIGFLGVLAAVKLLTPAMALLDVALNANPISLVVIAIAALGVAMYEAWEKSAGFRNVMKDIASGFVGAGIIIVQAAQSIVDSVLGAFGSILHGAVDAFGWIPGIGGKLKAASAAFDGFKGSVDDAFSKTISTMQGWQQELSASATTAKTNLGDIETAFSNQSKAAADAKTVLDTYTTAVQQNGAQSTAAQAARQQLITDLTNAGVNAGTAQTDVTNYTSAITQNGASSTQAQAARQQLITDIINASNNANTGTTDLGNYTAAVRQNGTDSDAARAARAQLITDLENAGVQANTAKGLVDGLGGSINDLPAGKNISIDVTGQGTWTITGLQALLGNTNTGVLPTPSGHQHGGKIAGYGGGDTVLAVLEPGETVLPKEATTDPMTVAVAKKYGVPGFASGGIAGLAGGITASYNATQAAMVVSMQQALVDAITKAAAAVASAAGGGGISGAGVSNASAEAALKSAAAKMGWTGAQWQALYNVEMREAGFSLTAQNPKSGAYGMAQFINGPGEYAQYGGNSTTAAGQAVAMVNYIKCVPLDGRILTREGWKTYEQVSVGDETPGYDHATGKSRWTKVTAVHHYEDAPVTRLSSNRVSLRSTPNHRWLTEKNIQTGKRTCRREEFTQTQDISTRHRIRLAAQHDDPEGLPITLVEAELLGWIAGDGHTSYPTRNSVNASVFQSEAKPKHLAALRVLLETTPHTEYTRPPVAGRAPIHQFRLRSPYVRDLFNRSEYEGDLELMVLAMSANQRAAFVAGLLEADGYQRPGDGIWTFTQNDGPVLRAFILAAFLMGYWCNATDSAGQKHVVLHTAYVGSGSGFTREELERQPVWCVTTELGSWTVEQDGQVFLTGNSRYGTPEAAWAHEQQYGWYAQGGLINEPVTGVGVSGRMYKFGEAGPEYVIPGNKASGVPGASGSRVEALLEQLIAVTGSLPHGITGGIGNALSGAAQSASFRTRYPRSGA